MTKIKNNKLLSLIIAFVVSFSFFSVFENVTVNAASSLGSVIDGGRSEERRVGKECRSRWSPYH